MSGILGRLKKAEEAASVVNRPPPVYLWMEPGESDEECLKRHGAGFDPKSVTFVSWAEGPAD